MLKPYGNWHGDSGITHYDDDLPDAIVIQYANDPAKRYIFKDVKVGTMNVRDMKLLARSGIGLAELINTNKLRGEKLP